jgi:2-C-methyl-D-erythritol 4-phosphate cytidylyltransferase/2-C-methyl-D-erythritol 2,4-cyclodiphosphate synthase
MPGAEAREIAALIVAAGRGTRAGEGGPKQYRTIGGRPVVALSIDPFAASPAVRMIQPVIHADDREVFTAAIGNAPKVRDPVAGGATRQESVRLGLEALAMAGATHVLIHDAARPFVSGALVRRVTDALADHDAVLPASPVADTVVRAGPNGTAEAWVDRSGLYAAETPQGFALPLILEAHRRAAAAAMSFTDDAGVARWAGATVKIVAGERSNMKLTTAEDIAAGEARLRAEELLRLGEVRVGTGYDVHRFGPGSAVTLGGVPIPHSQGLVGHSDADVGLHALTDALLGTIGEGDIGSHFPPSDPAFRGASSDRFLSAAVARVRARGGHISHLDLTIIAEAPKIGPHREAMRARIASIAGIDVTRVAVKATTNEGLGSIGRGEGIAAIGTATVRLPLGPA